MQLSGEEPLAELSLLASYTGGSGRASLNRQLEKVLGAIIREDRIARGMSQHVYAEWLGCWPSQLSRIESGEAAAQMSDLFGMARLMVAAGEGKKVYAIAAALLAEAAARVLANGASVQSSLDENSLF